MSVKSKVRSATRAVTKVFTTESDNPAEVDILDTLKKEHNEVKTLLSELQEASTPAQRRGLVQKIKAALIPHTKAEEKVVYDAVIAPGTRTRKSTVTRGYLEHEWASKTLQRLDSITNTTSPEHKATAKVLKELVEHHISEEESNVWDDVTENFSDDDRKRMNVAFERAKARVKIQ